MLRRVYIIITNRSINNPTIAVNDNNYHYGDTYEEGSTLNIRVMVNGYSDFTKQVTVPSSNLVLNIELVSTGNFVDLTSAQTITGVKTIVNNYESSVATAPSLINKINSEAAEGTSAKSDIVFSDINNKKFRLLRGITRISESNRYGIQLILRANESENTNLFGLNLNGIQVNTTAGKSLAKIPGPYSDVSNRVNLTFGNSPISITVTQPGWIYVSGKTTANNGYIRFKQNGTDDWYQYYQALYFIIAKRYFVVEGHVTLTYKSFNADTFRFVPAIGCIGFSS